MPGLNGASARTGWCVPLRPRVKKGEKKKESDFGILIYGCQVEDTSTLCTAASGPANATWVSCSPESDTAWDCKHQSACDEDEHHAKEKEPTPAARGR